MSDVYKIAVSIGMQNGVSSVLHVIQRDLMGLNHTIDLTANKLSRMQVAVMGGMTAMAGVGVLAAWGELARAGGKILDQQQIMLSNGTSQVDLAREMAAAYNMVNIGGSNLSDNLKMVADLRQLLGSQNLGEAITLAPTMMKAGIAAGLMTGKSAEDSAYKIALIEDNLGYTINRQTGQMDPQRAAHTADLIDAIISGTNGRVTPDMLLAFAKQARTSGRLLSDQGLMDMVPVIQAMGGYRSGTGLQAFDRALVGGVMTTRGTTWLEKLGLLNSANVHRAESGYARLDPNSIKGSDIMAQDPQLWANTILMPALQKSGMSMADALKTLAPGMDQSEGAGLSGILTQILQSGLANTTNGLLAELLGNSVQNAKDVVNVQQATGTSQYDTVMQSLSGAWQDFDGAVESLFDTLGLPAAKMGVTTLNDLAGGIREFDVWLGEHPGYATAIDRVLLGLGVGLTALGTIALGGALASMVGTGGLMVLLAAALVGLGSAALSVPGALEAVDKDLQRFAWSLLHPWSKGSLFLPDGGPDPSKAPPPGMKRIPAGRGHGAMLVSDNPSGESISQAVGDAVAAMNNAQDAALKAMHDWVAAGAPVTVSNPGDIATASSTATLKRIQHQMTAPPNGTTGANYRATPSGSAANGAK